MTGYADLVPPATYVIFHYMSGILLQCYLIWMSISHTVAEKNDAFVPSFVLLCHLVYHLLRHSVYYDDIMQCWHAVTYGTVSVCLPVSFS